MSNYYYLIAQLPGFTSAAPVSYSYFTELCSRFLSKKDMRILNSLTLDPPRSSVKAGSALVGKWFAWERSLRLALAGLRAARMKKAAVVSPLSLPPEIQQIAKTAVGFDDPLQAEVFLDTERSKALQTLSGMDGFSADTVFAYALRLKLAERRSLFSEESGMASYRTIYNQILGEAK